MYWFPLPFQLPVVIWPVQCWKWHKKTKINKYNKVNSMSVCESDKGKHMFRDFSKVCHKVDFSNVVNKDSFFSVNLLHPPSVNTFLKTLIWLVFNLISIIWLAHLFLNTLRIAACMGLYHMTPIFGHYVGRSTTVSSTLPIHIGQILGVLVLVLFTDELATTGVGFCGIKTCIQVIFQSPNVAILLLVI